MSRKKQHKGPWTRPTQAISNATFESINQFLDEETVFDREEAVPAKDLYAAYSAWYTKLAEAGLIPMVNAQGYELSIDQPLWELASYNKFAINVGRRFIKKTYPVPHYLGLCLR